MFRRILVPVDFDDLTPGVLGRAIELARLAGGRCHLVHVIERIGGLDDFETRAFYEGLERRAQGLVEDLEGRCTEAEIACESTVRLGKRWRVILETAAAWEADVIVIGSRPPVLDGKPHLGSTSHQVFLAATCPVLVIRTAASG